jgi:hypothetical protein
VQGQLGFIVSFFFLQGFQYMELEANLNEEGTDVYGGPHLLPVDWCRVAVLSAVSRMPSLDGQALPCKHGHNLASTSIGACNSHALAPAHIL